MRYLGKVWFREVPEIERALPIGIILDSLEHENHWTHNLDGNDWVVFWRGKGVVKVHVSSSDEAPDGTLMVYALKVHAEERIADKVRDHLYKMGWMYRPTVQALSIWYKGEKIGEILGDDLNLPEPPSELMVIAGDVKHQDVIWNVTYRK